MILKGAEAERFLANPTGEVVAVLFYGPDAGLVAERAKGLVAKATGGQDDPFAVVELTRRDLADEPRRLADELASIPLTGGRPVVRLRDAGDDAAGGLTDVLSGEPGGGLLVVEAGDLPPRSAIRKLFEGNDLAAAIACYQDDEKSLPSLVKQVLAESGLTVGRDALAALVRSMGSDRLLSRRELDKLVQYKGPDGGEVTLEDVLASVGDSAEVTLDDLAFAVAGGDRPGLERALERARASGAQPVSLLRAVSRHFQRLHQAAAAMEGGLTVERAMATLRPGVFWKLKGPFTAQLQAWGAQRLAAALVELTACEGDAKTGAGPQALLVERALWRLAVNAPRRAGR